MSFDANGIGSRASLGMTAGVTAFAALDALPMWIRAALSALFLAFVNFAIEWARWKRAELKQRREVLEAQAEPANDNARTRDDSAPGYSRLGALALVAALALAACGGRFFLRVFSEPALGKCIASGYAREFSGDPEFTSYSGGLQCLSAPTLPEPDESTPLARDGYENDAALDENPE